MKRLIDIARGNSKASLVYKNAKIVNVYTNTVEQGDIAIYNGIIAGIGSYHGVQEIDLNGKYVVPGLIDSHLHIESSMMTPSRFSDAIIKYGITTVIADPHEIANVCGIEGIKYMIEDSRNSIVDYKFMMPSCVPATPFETSGAMLNGTIVDSMMANADIYGLGEMMNYVGVINVDKDVLSKMESAKSYNKIIDGHAPQLTGKDLNAYIASGISTEHESSTIEEAREKISRGMYVLIREGTAAKNLEALIPLAKTECKKRLLFCSDDCHPYDLLNKGTINYSIKKAIEYGIDTIDAINIATLNAAICYNLKDRGAIAPGLKADIVVVDDLNTFKINKVIKNGKLVVDNGILQVKSKTSKMFNINSFNVKQVSVDDIKTNYNSDQVNVIGLVSDSLLTDRLIEKTSNMAQDILKVCVVERHRNTGNIGIGLVKGYGLSNGAIATSIAHDSHNIIAVGDNDQDIVNAINKIIGVKGGITIYSETECKGVLELPIGGLMTDKDVVSVNNKYEQLVNIARDMGVIAGVHPFMSLSFLALPVIPHLKITDKGLFDVDKFEYIELDEI